MSLEKTTHSQVTINKTFPFDWKYPYSKRRLKTIYLIMTTELNPSASETWSIKQLRHIWKKPSRCHLYRLPVPKQRTWETSVKFKYIISYYISTFNSFHRHRLQYWKLLLSTNEIRLHDNKTNRLRLLVHPYSRCLKFNRILHPHLVQDSIDKCNWTLALRLDVLLC